MDARVRGHDGIFVIPAEAGIHKRVSYTRGQYDRSPVVNQFSQSNQGGTPPITKRPTTTIQAMVMGMKTFQPSRMI